MKAHIFPHVCRDKMYDQMPNCVAKEPVALLATQVVWVSKDCTPSASKNTKPHSILENLSQR